MAKPVTGLTQFQTNTTNSLVSLDNNFTSIANAINDPLSYANYGIDSGAVNAMVLTLTSYNMSGYADGQPFFVRMNHTTTSTAVTLNVNSFGAKNVYYVDGTALAVGQLILNSTYAFVYNSTFNSGAGGFELVTTSNVVPNLTFPSLTIGPPPSGTALTVNGSGAVGPMISSTESVNGLASVIFQNSSAGASAEIDLEVLSDVVIARLQVLSAAAGGNARLFTQSNHPLLLGANSATAMTIATNGAISTTAPASAVVGLTVNGSAAGGDVIDALQSFNGTGAVTFQNSNAGASAEFDLFLKSDAVIARMQVLSVAAGGNARLFTQSNHPLLLGANNATAVTIGTPGTVTIAAPTSGVPLTVNGVAGSDVADFTLSTNGAAQLTLSNPNAGASASAQASVTSNNGSINIQMASTANSGLGILTYTGTDALDIYTTAGTPLQFGTNSVTNRVQIGSAGNVVLNATGSAPATSATNGFFYPPACAGLPTGTPATTFTGAIPAIFDSSTNMVMFVWVTLTNGGSAWVPINGVLPTTNHTSNYQFAAGDIGTAHNATSGTLTFTIPANGTVSYPVGTVIGGFNSSGNNLTIAITTDTLKLNNSASTGSRTVANNCKYILEKIATTTWVAMGAGVT